MSNLQWFTRGFYAASRVGDDIAMTDLRMGGEPIYVFSFTVAKWADPGPIAAADVRRGVEFDLSNLAWV